MKREEPKIEPTIESTVLFSNYSPFIKGGEGDFQARFAKIC